MWQNRTDFVYALSCDPGSILSMLLPDPRLPDWCHDLAMRMQMLGLRSVLYSRKDWNWSGTNPYWTDLIMAAQQALDRKVPPPGSWVEEHQEPLTVRPGLDFELPTPPDEQFDSLYAEMNGHILSWYDEFMPLDNDRADERKFMCDDMTSIQEENLLHFSCALCPSLYIMPGWLYIRGCFFARCRYLL